jgi:hypothetical protein
MHSKLDSKQPLATRKFLFSGRLQSTPLRHSDMNSSFPIPVIGKVALCKAIHSDPLLPFRKKQLYQVKNPN